MWQAVRTERDEEGRGGEGGGGKKRDQLMYYEKRVHEEFKVERSGEDDLRVGGGRVVLEFPGYPHTPRTRLWR